SRGSIILRAKSEGTPAILGYRSKRKVSKFARSRKNLIFSDSFKRPSPQIHRLQSDGSWPPTFSPETPLFFDRTIFQQVLQFGHHLLHVLEVHVDAGEPHVGHFVELL